MVVKRAAGIDESTAASFEEERQGLHSVSQQRTRRRSDARGEFAFGNVKTLADSVAELESDTGKAPIFLLCDLASLASVKKAAEDFKR